ncbi:hypothetical protein [Streptomyces sp. NPDC058145]|uniref:hypothetical protein n=1 Tax=Streptomyces sp. NPDC058145 TaxID=3346356 RepID=UPI0036E53D79
MTGSQARLLAWLNAAPKVLAWTQDHVSWRDASGTEVLTGYVDVDIPQASATARLSWTWTVDPGPDPDEADEPRWFVIELPYTVTVHAVTNRTLDQASGYKSAAAIVPAGGELTTEQAQRLIRLAAEHRAPFSAIGGWHPEDISAAIAEWILRNTGLHKELRYDPTLPSVMAERLMRRLHPEDQDLVPKPSSSSTPNRPAAEHPRPNVTPMPDRRGPG